MSLKVQALSCSGRKEKELQGGLKLADDECKRNHALAMSSSGLILLCACSFEGAETKTVQCMDIF